MPSDALNGSPADLVTLKRIYAESGAAATPSATDWSEYAERVVEWIASAMFRDDNVAVNVARFERVTVYLILAGLLVLVIVGALTLWRTLRSSVTVVSLEGAAPLLTSKTGLPRPDAEAHARFERNDLLGSLEASWWWFARIALGREPAAGMTTLDVLRSGRRPELTSVGRDLDRLRFSPAIPDRGAIQALLARLSSLR